MLFHFQLKTKRFSFCHPFILDFSFKPLLANEAINININISHELSGKVTL